MATFTSYACEARFSSTASSSRLRFIRRTGVGYGAGGVARVLSLLIVLLHSEFLIKVATVKIKLKKIHREVLC